MAFLPAEGILMQANLFDTHEPPPAKPTPAMTTLYRQIRLLNLNVSTLAPVHGRPVPMSDFLKAMGDAGKECPKAGAGGSVAWEPCQ
jgi:hypothetical protein